MRFLARGVQKPYRLLQKLKELLHLKKDGKD